MTGLTGTRDPQRPRLESRLEQGFARPPAGARGAAIGKGAAIVDEQQRPAMAMSRCRLVLPVCVASAG